ALSITYQKVPTENLPHRVRFYNAGGDLLGSAAIMQSGTTLATSTFSAGDFTTPLGLTGPTSITIKIIDSAGNETGSVKEIVHDSSAPNVTSMTLSGMATFSAGIYYYNNLSLGNMTANVVCSNATDQMRLTVASSSLLATETFALTHLGSGNYQGSFGTTLDQAVYALGIVDAAGNLHTGLSYTALVVDNTAPTVTAVLPDTVIGNTPATLATFTVTFSEPMEPSIVPVLTLATTTAMQTIYMDFVGWDDPAIATTARFVNRFDIGTTYPSGAYNYRVDGGSDLAGNPLNFAPAVPFSVDVQAQGPAAALKIYTLQPAIFGSTLLENVAYSTLVNSSASIHLTYNSGPFNTPHQLRVYNPAGNYVATLSLNAGNVATFPGDLAGWLNGTGPDTDGIYSFRLMDALGNIAPASGYMDRKLYLDRTAASISTFNFNDGGHGIATGGIIYYSPAVAGSATVTLTSLATDSLRLVASGTATYTFNLASATTTHTGQFGGSLPEGLYEVSVADFAGNFSTGATASAMLVVDNDKPAVFAALPATTIGAVSAGDSVFVITFDEPMNQNIAPSVRLATSTKEVQLQLTSWIDEFSCRLAPASAINDTFPAGTYSYIITGAKDRAGNIASPTIAGEFTVGVYARGPQYNATLTSKQSRISTETVLLNQPFSPFAEPGIATLTIAYSEGPFSKPHQIKLYDSGNVEVNTINLVDSGTDSIAAVNSAFFNNPGAVNAKVHKFRVVDSLGNLSATASLNLIYDESAPNVASLSLTNVSANSSKPLYYHNPALHGNLVATAETTNASDPLRLLLTTGTATSTWQMESTIATPFKHSYSMTAADSSPTNIPDGTYGVTIVDAAGNFATGAESNALLIVDRAAPLVNTATISNGLYLSSGPAGAAT
ncbi:MAG: hypothetical protein PHD82_17485, partial [Candidatus Riflebacteria bacterium]|nr:hypothetical protein [Candidatus Riflebacteria bacterium]